MNLELIPHLFLQTVAGSDLSRFLPGRRKQNVQSGASLAALLFTRFSTSDHLRSTERTGLRPISLCHSASAPAATGRTWPVSSLQTDGSWFERLHFAGRISRTVRTSSFALRTSAPGFGTLYVFGSIAFQMRFRLAQIAAYAVRIHAKCRQTCRSLDVGFCIHHRTDSGELNSDQPIVGSVHLSSSADRSVLFRAAFQVGFQRSSGCIRLQVECVRHNRHLVERVLWIFCCARIVRASFFIHSRSSSRSFSDPFSRHQEIQRYGRRHVEHAVARTVARRLLRVLRAVHLFRAGSRTVWPGHFHSVGFDSTDTSQSTAAQLFRRFSHRIR